MGFGKWNHTEEAKRNISEKMRAFFASESPEKKALRYSKRGPLSPETRAKISAAHLGMKHTPESRAKMSRTRKSRGYTIPPERRAEISKFFKGRPSPYPNRRFYHKGIPLRSSWELRCAQALDAMGVRWEFECRRFDLGSQTYAPDFYLPDDGAFWEVKGYFGPKSQRTVALFRAAYPEIPLVLVTEDALLAVERAAAARAA